jgi:hypothetical protein
MQGKKESTGIKTTKSNRPLFLETLHTRLINKSIIVKSKRFVKELGTFIYNKQTKRAEAEKGYHDDAIMAMSLALYAKEERSRNLPTGYNGMEEMREAYKLKILEEIKNELSKDAPDGWFKDEPEVENEFDGLVVPDYFKRPNDKLLKSFGW